MKGRQRERERGGKKNKGDRRFSSAAASSMVVAGKKIRGDRLCPLFSAIFSVARSLARDKTKMAGGKEGEIVPGCQPPAHKKKIRGQNEFLDALRCCICGEGVAVVVVMGGRRRGRGGPRGERRGKGRIRGDTATRGERGRQTRGDHGRKQ